MAVNEQINSTSVDDWELIADVSRSLLQGEKQLSKLSLDVSLSGNFIAVEVLTSTSQPNWVAGGYIAQVYKLDALNLTSKQHFITINQINFIELNQIASFDFDLIYNPPKYFKDVQLKVWKYQGVQTNLLLQDIARFLDNVSIDATIDLSEVNQKLDTLISLSEASNSQKLAEIEAKLNFICEKLSALTCSNKSKELFLKEKFFIIN